jgi:hypothetical protein
MQGKGYNIRVDLLLTYPPLVVLSVMALKFIAIPRHRAGTDPRVQVRPWK